MFLFQRVPSVGLYASVAVALLGLSACGSGSSDSGSGSLSTHTIGGTVTGLKNERLALKNNDSEPLEVIGASFSFPAALSNGSAYRVTVASNPDQQLCSVENGTGTLTGADVTDVDVLCRYWRSAGLMETSSESANSPEIVFGPTGQGIALWLQYDGSANSLYASHFSSGSWGTPEVIETSSDSVSAQQVVMDTAGNAIAVWAQNFTIYANYFSADSGSWGTAESIQTGSAYANSPDIAIDSSGNGIAVWSQGNNIYANHFSATDGSWGTAELVETGTDSANSPHIAMDPSGNAIAVWLQNNSIYTNRFADGAWGTEELLYIPYASSQAILSPRIEVDSSGNAFAIWREGNFTKHIYAKRFSVADDSWGTDYYSIDTASPTTNYAQVVLDPSGNAIVVWQQARYNGASNSILTRRFSVADDSWADIEQIDSTGEEAGLPHIATDPSGNVIAVWKQQQSSGAAYSIYANRYSAADDSWDTEAELIETRDETADAPRAAVDASGNAFALWVQSDGTANSIYANRFE